MINELETMTQAQRDAVLDPNAYTDIYPDEPIPDYLPKEEY